MKLTGAFFISLLVVFLMKSEVSSQSRVTGEEFLKAFYTEYIRKCDQPTSEHEKFIEFRNFHCSKKLLQDINTSTLDYDPFLNAQDCSENWINSLKVVRATEKDATYQVTYNTGFNDVINVVELTLKPNGSTYLIDSIKGW